MIQFLQKSIAGFLIFIALTNIVLVIFIYHKQAQAFNPFVWDIPHTVATIGGWIKSGLAWVWDKAKWVIDKAWDKVVWLWQKRQALKGWLWETAKEATKKALSKTRKKVLDYTVNHLVNYIQYGGREGGPSFIPDWRKFLYEGKGSVLDQAAGEFANTFWQNITAELAPEVQAAMESAGISTTNLCEIEPGTWTNLVIEAGIEPVEKFTSKDVACTAIEAGETLLDAKQKLQKFYDGDFNWDTWLKIQEPQNNVYGFYLTVLDKKAGIEGEKIEAEKSKAIASTGWLGKERCATWVNNDLNTGPEKATIEYDDAIGKVGVLRWWNKYNERGVTLNFTMTLPENKSQLLFNVKNVDDVAKTLFDPETDSGYYVFPIGLDREAIAKEDGELIFEALKDPNILGPSGYGFTCTSYETITPGQVIGQTVAKHFGGEIDWLMSTDEMEKYSTALATAGINRLFSEGVGLLGKWLSDDEIESQAGTPDDPYQKFLASLPEDTQSDIKTRNEASGKAFDTAQKDYRKLTGYQEGLADDKKQENVVAAADTPAGELLYALLDLENALKKLKTSQETLQSLQDENLKSWQEKALLSLFRYHLIKNAYYRDRFCKNPQYDKNGVAILCEGGDNSKEELDQCYSEELEREYSIKYDDKADYRASKTSICSGKNPRLCEGTDENKLEGLFISHEKIDLISQRLGKIIGASIDYSTLNYEENILYAFLTNPAVKIQPKISTKEQEKIQRLIDSIGSTAEKKGWLGDILDARDKIREKVHLGQFSYLDLQRIYLAIYNWATSIDSQEKTILTELELQGLERLNGIWSHLVNWREIWDDPTKGPDKLEESLNEDEYARTQEFMETAYCRTGETCTDDDVIEEARQKMIAMSDEAKQILDNAEQYANSVESPSGTKIDFYKEQIGLNRFQNALEGNEQGIILAGAKVLSSTSAELNEYLGIESQNLCARCVDINGNFLLECVINYWEETAESSGLSEDELDAIFKELETYVKAGYTTIKPDAFEPTTKLKLCDDACAKEIKASQICEEKDEAMPTLTLAELIQEVRKVEEIVKEKVADIEAGFREMTFETSSPDITPSAVYHKQLQSIINIYNDAYEKWKSCLKALTG